MAVSAWRQRALSGFPDNAFFIDLCRRAGRLPDAVMLATDSTDSSSWPAVSLAGNDDIPELTALWLQQANVAVQPVFRTTGALEQLVRHPERGCCLLIREGGVPVAALALSFFLSLRDGGRCAMVTDSVGRDPHIAMLLGAAVGYAAAHGILHLLLEEGAVPPAVAAGAGFTAGPGVWRHRAAATGKNWPESQLPAFRSFPVFPASSLWNSHFLRRPHFSLA